MEINKLKKLIPANVLAEIPNIITKFNINTELRLAHFLAQCAHESGNFKATVENLNYSADGLMRTFNKYFRGINVAAYERKPELIANRVYASRMGNGDEKTGDGFRFRGRGYIQLTGKSNYTDFDKFVDDNIIANPDLVSTKYPLLSAAWFFHKNGLNSICDRGATEAVVRLVTQRVNGGTNGLEDRISKFNIYYKALTA